MRYDELSGANIEAICRDAKERAIEEQVLDEIDDFEELKDRDLAVTAVTLSRDHVGQAVMGYKPGADDDLRMFQ